MTPVIAPNVLVKQAAEKLRLAAAASGVEGRGFKLIAAALDAFVAGNDLRMSTAASLLNSAAYWCNPDDLTLADMLQEWTFRELPDGWVIETPRACG